jgi:hypothetical protein
MIIYREALDLKLGHGVGQYEGKWDEGVLARADRVGNATSRADAAFAILSPRKICQANTHD